jgi:hypothetical protein
LREPVKTIPYCLSVIPSFILKISRECWKRPGEYEQTGFAWKKK